MNIANLRTKLDETTWIDGPDGARFQIRSTESKRYKATLADITRRYPPAKVRKDPDTQAKIAKEAMAREILVDFEGIEDNGTPLTNTLENRMLLVEIPEIRDLIATEAQDLGNFRKEALAADAADIKSDR